MNAINWDKLYHQTGLDGILGMLITGKMLPSSKTKKKNQNPYAGYLPYNFFNAVPDKKIKLMPTVAIAFKSDVLIDKIFYTSVKQSAGDLNWSTRYKLDNVKDINKALLKVQKHFYKLCKKDKINIEFPYFVLNIFHEIFTKVEFNIKDAKYILLKSEKEILKYPRKYREKTEEIIELVKEKYPNIKILRLDELV